MSAQPTITMKLTPEERESILGAYLDASGVNAKPEGWRIAEYIMEKTAAREILQSFVKQASTGEVTLTFFDWSLMQGEVARLYMSYGTPEPDSLSEDKKNGALFVYAMLQRKMRENSRYDKMIRVMEKQEETQRKIDKAQRDIEEGNRQMLKLRQEAMNLEYTAQKLGGTTDD
jgi:hypothetical protein